MDYEEFKSIAMGYGYTELEARWLWSGKPEGHKATVAGVTFACQTMLPTMLKAREKLNHEEILRVLIAIER